MPQHPKSSHNTHKKPTSQQKKKIRSKVRIFFEEFTNQGDSKEQAMQKALAAAFAKVMGKKK